MSDAFQRLLTLSGPEAQSLNAQAALGVVRAPKRSQFELLLRHFFERFFMQEGATSTDDAKTRMVQLAVAAGLPGFVVAIYLWPVYHHVIVFRQDHPINDVPVSYWAQTNHHFFFVMYSFVAMGLITVFAWERFFPDLLDVFVLGTLPVGSRRVFAARVSAIGLFLGGFLAIANALAPVVLPMATDPPDLNGFLLGHVSAVVLAGLFASGLVLALEGVLLAVAGEKLFRKVSLVLQGAAVAGFLVLLLLFPVLSGVTPALIEAGGAFGRWFPPFWFLGMYQERLHAPENLPVWGELAWRGAIATAVVWGVAVAAYPVAHARRVRSLVEGTASRAGRNALLRPWHRLMHATVVRKPLHRAVFHFIGQTLTRVPRYRISLVLYCGAGFSLLMASLLRFSTNGGVIHAEVSADGMRMAVGIIAFWVIAGLRSTFISPGQSRGGWIFRSIHGEPARYEDAKDKLEAARICVLLWAGILTLGAIGGLQTIAPEGMRHWNCLVAQLAVGVGMVLLLTDAFFMNVTMTPFSGERSSEEHNLAFTVLRYFTFFPLVTFASLQAEMWVEAGGAHLGYMLGGVVLGHLWMRKRRRDVVRMYASQLPVEEDEEDFPMRLGLRY